MLRDIISLSHSRCSRDITIQIFEGIQVGEIHFDQNYDGYSSPLIVELLHHASRISVASRKPSFEIGPPFMDSQLNLDLLIPKIESVRLIDATVCCHPPSFLIFTRLSSLALG